MAVTVKSPIAPSALAPLPLYQQLRKALVAMKARSGQSTVHHSFGNGDLRWNEQREEGFEVKFQRGVFQIQLRLETHQHTREQRVIMFCRRTDPPSSAVSENTQRGTFNSKNRAKDGFFQRLQVLKAHPEQRRALAELLPATGAYPRWIGGRIHLGDGTVRLLLHRFLKATALIEEIKGTEAAALNRRFPPAAVFSAADIAAATFAEGKRRQVSKAVRDRSAKLRQLAIGYYEQQAPDGTLRCFVDDWAPTIPVRGSIIEIHHDDELAGYPEEGKTVTFDQAIKFLFPLCPNCHRLLPAKPGGGRYSIPELRALLQRRKKEK